MGSTSVFSQTNLLVNGDFENGTNGWDIWGATFSVSNDAKTGKNAVAVSKRKNPWDAIVQDITDVIENGQTYNLSVWLKMPKASTGVRATLRLDVDGIKTYNTFFWHNDPSIETYQEYVGEYTPNWSGNLNSASLYFETGEVGGIYSDYIIDDAVLTTVEQDQDEVVITQGWKDIKSTMYIGGCVTEGSIVYFNNNKAKSQVLSDCNSVQVQCYPAWGRWDETLHHAYHIDEFNTQVKEVKSKRMRVTAHMLMGWDQYFPAWYKNNDFHKDTLDAILKSWIKSIVSYNGNDTLVDIWNVINESISWNGKGGYWELFNANHNNACEMQRMGFEPDASGLTGSQKVNSEHPIYIRKAFEYARMYTNKKLELRETSCEFPKDQKYDAFYQLALHLKNSGVPVDVIGFQSHLNIGQVYDWDGYSQNIKRFKDLGFEVNITEVDIGDQDKKWTDEKAELQKDYYHRLVKAAIKGGAGDFQTWGFYDNNISGWRYQENAFPFTDKIEKKSAYFGIQEALIDMSHILFWEMDEIINGDILDVMTYGNNGKVKNFANQAIVDGFKGKSIAFDGVDDMLETAELSDKINDDFTFTCFLKTTTNKPSVIANLIGESGEVQLKIDSNGKLFIDNLLQSEIDINDGYWHFIALQRDSSIYRLYVDNAFENITAIGGLSGFDRLIVGASANSELPFAGVIDEVKLYDTIIEEASFLRNMIPYCPLNLQISKSKMKMYLKWIDQSDNEKGFIVERKTAGSSWVEYRNTNENIKTYTDTLSLYNTEYSYRIRAFNKFGKSVVSNSVTVLSPQDTKTRIKTIEKTRESSIHVYPNPVDEIFTLISNRNCALEIVDFSGKIVLKDNSISPNKTFNIQHLSKGMYVLKTFGDNKIETTKFIKK